MSVKTTTDFHDRFLIIDKTEVYHIGASIKDAGKKSFGITKIEDKDFKQKTAISRSTFYKLKKDENVTTDVLLKICEELNCDISEIVECVER